MAHMLSGEDSLFERARGAVEDMGSSDSIPVNSVP